MNQSLSREVEVVDYAGFSGNKDWSSGGKVRILRCCWKTGTAGSFGLASCGVSSRGRISFCMEFLLFNFFFCCISLQDLQCFFHDFCLSLISTSVCPSKWPFLLCKLET
ncbi:hypothetical protein Ancab_008992 [Ancistrocladus abbreviatus]